MSLRVLWAGLNLVVATLVSAPLTLLARLLDSNYKYTMKTAQMWAIWVI